MLGQRGYFQDLYFVWKILCLGGIQMYTLNEMSDWDMERKAEKIIGKGDCYKILLDTESLICCRRKELSFRLKTVIIRFPLYKRKHKPNYVVGFWRVYWMRCGRVKFLWILKLSTWEYSFLEPNSSKWQKYRIFGANVLHKTFNPKWYYLYAAITRVQGSRKMVYSPLDNTRGGNVS